MPSAILDEAIRGGVKILPNPVIRVEFCERAFLCFGYRVGLRRGRFCLPLSMSVVAEIALLFLDKHLTVPEKPAHCERVAGVYEGQVWVVYCMSVVIGIVILLFNRYFAFATKPAPTTLSPMKHHKPQW